MQTIIGIDEVGRGSWAGPLLVVAAKSKRTLPLNLADSKVLTKKQRELLIDQIIDSCYLGEGWVQPHEIDKLGLTRAMRMGVSRALMDIGALLEDNIIIDGLINYCPPEFMNVKTLVKADATSPIVSAASIYAKVKRDQHMSRAAQFYPDYGFEKHVGYGTKLHVDMLNIHGISKIHRMSFRPIKAIMK